MLREESEEQAKRMLLPLLTLHRTFWSPGCYANTPSTWQQTHMRLACEYRYVRFLHLRMQRSQLNRLASFDMPWKAYCKEGGNCYGRFRK
jgi:hypothetical protein